MTTFKTVNPKEVSTGAFHGFMLGAVAPRPIAFASTIDNEGNVNLSPFSFFNAFGANPPTLIFSPARRVRDNTTKHTLENAQATKEVVINIVNYPIVEQMSLASTEYDQGVNEFNKSGLTEEPSLLVKPPRVKEAPAAFECIVKDIIETGTEGGAGNLIVCEVVMAHFNEAILDEDGKVDPFKADLVARMGGNWYCRANGDALFEIEKPIRNKGIGVDQLPEAVRNSHVLTGNNLGKLGNVEKLPESAEVSKFSESDAIQAVRKETGDLQENLHRLAQKYLANNEVTQAWLTLLQK
ncbi:flavin reductase family protein [Microscilla marina]|uniref:Nitrilotriacetate monooxygenase component B n=1 Tax=Microscilla marina ATCC 23134 TaxID=313606 RepID=A1ZWZ4_MICM2|nr:flavin reductase family protein [Microscilla marina]EAY25074.1 nitrilotriacetate monooxygenase component B [Microscilla marina ATCC 23134]